MLSECIYTSGGGGSYQCKEGDFSTSTTNDTYVDLGFQPDYVLVQQKRTTKPYIVYFQFDRNFWGTSKQGQTYVTSGGDMTYANIDIPATAFIYGGFMSIGASGFTVSKMTGNANYEVAPECHYFAVKF